MWLLECFDPVQEASYDYMEKEGERMFLECLDQLEVASAAEVQLFKFMVFDLLTHMKIIASLFSLSLSRSSERAYRL